MQVPTLDTFVRYEKIGEPDEDGCREIWSILGVVGPVEGTVHLWRSYNTFDVEHTCVPEGYVKQTNGYLDCDECVALKRCCPADEEARKQQLNNYYFGTKIFAEDYKPAVVEVPANAEVVFTHDNGGRPFKVIVDRDRKEISVYSLNRNVIFEKKKSVRANNKVVMFTKPMQLELAMNPREPSDENDENEEPSDENDENEEPSDDNDIITWNMLDYYDQFVIKATFEQVWIPDGRYLTRNDAGDIVQDRSAVYYGNSVLAHLNEATYLWIGSSVKQFYSNDKILRYYSVVGNSDVPYPVAVGTTGVYFMIQTPITCEPREKYVCKFANENRELTF